MLYYTAAQPGIFFSKRLLRHIVKLKNLTLFPFRHVHYSTKSSINITFLIQNDISKSVSVESGKTILEAAHENGVELEGACDGCLACSTCHVILEEEVYNKLPEPSEAELDMLDLAPGLTDT